YVYYSSTHHYSHNDFIEILASMGLPAFLIYITIFFDYGRKISKLFKHTIGYYKKLITVALAFYIAYLAFGIWDPSVYFPTTTLMFAFFYSLIIKIDDQYQLEKKIYFLKERNTSKIN